MKNTFAAVLLIITGMMLGDSGIANSNKDQSLLIRGDGFTIKAGHPDNDKVLGSRNGAIIFEEGHTFNSQNMIILRDNGEFKRYNKGKIRFIKKGSAIFDLKTKKIIMLFKHVGDKKFGKAKQYKGSINVAISPKGKVLYSWVWIRTHRGNFNITKGLQDFNIAIQDSINNAVEVSLENLDGLDISNDVVDESITESVSKAIESQITEATTQAEKDDIFEGAINDAIEGIAVAEVMDGEINASLNDALANSIQDALDNLNIDFDVSQGLTRETLTELGEALESGMYTYDDVLNQLTEDERDQLATFNGATDALN